MKRSHDGSLPVDTFLFYWYARPSKPLFSIVLVALLCLCGPTLIAFWMGFCWRAANPQAGADVALAQLEDQWAVLVVHSDKQLNGGKKK